MKGWMMSKRRSYSGTFKAEVVVQAIKGEKTLDELAAEYDVHPNQIKNWKTVLYQRAAEVLEDRRKSRI